MSAFLVFRLYGPLCSWGDIAVGEERSSQPHPGKSAVLGLVAACLGIRRREEQRLLDLEAGLGLAVAVQSRGRALTDFHTAQVPPARRNRKPLVCATRREEILALTPDDDAILSRRQYRVDALYLACLWRRGQAAPALEEIGAALEQPALIPYLGRKCCPTALPFQPRIVEATDLSAALSQSRQTCKDGQWCGGIPQRGAIEVFWEVCRDQPETGLAARETYTRRDALVSRRRWHYQPRQEARGVLAGQPAGEG
jgi:CRISPR system Cascade subunit CasD